MFEDQLTIITIVGNDYGELIFKHGYKPEGGVVFIRSQPREPLETGRLIEQLAQNPGLVFNRTLTVIDKDSIRQKKY